MNRSTVLYLVMFLALVAGLWAILRVGSRLEPPHDLSGSWSARPIDASPDADPLRMEIIQSGQFLTLDMPGAPLLKVRLTKIERAPDGEVAALHWEGGGAKIAVRRPTQPKTPDEQVRYWFQLEEPTRMTWRARRLTDKELTVISSSAAESH